MPAGRDAGKLVDPLHQTSAEQAILAIYVLVRDDSHGLASRIRYKLCQTTPGVTIFFCHCLPFQKLVEPEPLVLKL